MIQWPHLLHHHKWHDLDTELHVSRPFGACRLRKQRILVAPRRLARSTALVYPSFQGRLQVLADQRGCIRTAELGRASKGCVERDIFSRNARRDTKVALKDGQYRHRMDRTVEHKSPLRLCCLLSKAKFRRPPQFPADSSSSEQNCRMTEIRYRQVQYLLQRSDLSGCE